MSEQEREIEVVAGTIVGTITKKPDTWQVEVQPDGSQYTKKLWTKSSTLVAAANAKIGQHSAFVCSASYWQGPNGQVRSLWINEEADADTPVNAPQPTPEAAVALARVEASQKPRNAAEPVDWDNKERRDYRSRAWAQTLAAFTHTINVSEDPVAVFLRLQPFQRKIYEDVCQGFAWDDSDIPFD